VGEGETIRIIISELILQFYDVNLRAWSILLAARRSFSLLFSLLLLLSFFSPSKGEGEKKESR